MKIRPRDHVTFQADRMARVLLASTARTQVDLYCVGPGQAQRPHTHDDQDKVYMVLEGRGRIQLGEAEDRLEAGEVVLAPAGTMHGLVNDGPDPLLVLVVVTPPSPHAR
jgi:quercetin dioxygenase-like cupin family protein